MLLSICKRGEQLSLGPELARLFTGFRRRQAIALLAYLWSSMGQLEA